MAKRIFISQLASFFAPNNGIVGFILLWLCGLRLIAIGFDFRVFHPGLARGGLSPAHWLAPERRPSSTFRSASFRKPLSTTSAAGGSAKNFSKPCSSSRSDLTISSAAIERDLSRLGFLGPGVAVAPGSQ